ncbi:MAG: carboxypeptidase-like regulatory domain-containing protein [Chloroflexota bacterium]|nr:carboxypeptidase-like regulatory domain-containing protein [Chloroflexota bacterium]
MATTRPPGRRGGLRPALLVALPMLVVLAACDLSSSASASPSASASSERCGAEEVLTGGIDGIVVDSAGNPLDDIYIFIRAPEGFSGSTRTAEDGAFAAPGVSGEFQITTTDIDYAEVIRRVTVPCGELVEVELVLTPIE